MSRKTRNRAAGPGRDRRKSLEERRNLLRHDLRSYQQELVAQNDALQIAHAELERTRDRFIELYDLAPHGYITLDPEGVALQVNLTAAGWLGRRRETIEGLRLISVLDKADHAPFQEFMRRCRAGEPGVALTVDVVLSTPDGPRDVQLLCKAHLDPGGKARYLASMIDITSQKRLEAERRRAGEERAALTARLIAAQETERQRIARDLHDDAGQQLTGLRLTLDAIEHAFEDRARLRQAIVRAKAIGQQLDDTLDFIAARLRPVALDVSIAAAIEQFVREWSRTFGIEAVYRSERVEDLHMGREAQTHLYRIVQEAFNNVHKHAQATSVEVALERLDRRLRVTVDDNGRGFDLDRPRGDGTSGLGLIGMRERAEIAGGTLSITPRMPGGTRIVVEIPNAFPGVKKTARTSSRLRRRIRGGGAEPLRRRN